MGQINAKAALGLVATLLKGCVLAKGENIYLDADLLKRAEREFSLGVKDLGDKFEIRCVPGGLSGERQGGGIQLPESPKLWTPGQP